MIRKKASSPVPETIGRRRPPAEIFESGAELNATSVSFLKIDLDTALTFAEIALQAKDGDKRERNRHNARVGYDTVLRLLPKVSPTHGDAKVLTEKLRLLKADLVKLGERL